MKIRGLSTLALITALLVSTMSCQPATDSTNNNPSGDSTTASDTASDPAALPGEGVTIRPAFTPGVLEEQFMTEVINIGLEELGYELDESQQADYSALFVSLANGDLDYTPAYWEPIHIDFFENAGGEESMERLGEIFPDGPQGYMVDLNTSNEYDFTSLEQLQDPELAALFDTDGDGLANLTGCPSGWNCANLIDYHIEVYGLTDTVEQDSGNYSALLADTVTRYEQGEPVLLWVYSPHWILSALTPGEETTWLSVPFTDLPDAQATFTEEDTTVDGTNLGFISSTVRVLTNKTFSENHPAAKQWFELVSIPLADINQVSFVMYEGENSSEDIRRHAEEWVEANREQFDAWLEEARQAAS